MICRFMNYKTVIPDLNAKQGESTKTFESKWKESPQLTISDERLWSSGPELRVFDERKTFIIIKLPIEL